MSGGDVATSLSKTNIEGMLQEDQKRLEREADIARATRAPNYSTYNMDVGRVKAEASRRLATRQEHIAQQNAGIRSMSQYYIATYGSVPRIQE